VSPHFNHASDPRPLNFRLTEKYDENFFEKDWNSLKVDDSPSSEKAITIGTIYYWSQQDHLQRVSQSLQTVNFSPMLTSAMTINGWIQKYDGMTLDLVGLHGMAWDLMGCAARITKTTEYVLRNGPNDLSSVSFPEMDLKLKGCSVNQKGEKKPIPMTYFVQKFKQSILYATIYFEPTLGNKVDRTGDRHFKFSIILRGSSTTNPRNIMSTSWERSRMTKLSLDLSIKFFAIQRRGFPNGYWIGLRSLFRNHANSLVLLLFSSVRRVQENKPSGISLENW
jgi:hypothetical protein